ncbi:MAG: hypothetical protein FH762_07345 [Firmicutes bacterium]|nr:hypothetical protein [Bacillota bacterium]
MNKGITTNFFPGGNTSKGFYSYYKYLPYKTDKVFIIKGGPGTGKSTLMKKIGQQINKQGYDLELHWCSSDNNSLDGIVIQELGIAFLDGTSPHMIDPVNPGAVEEIINLGEFWDSNFLRTHSEEIIKTNNRIKQKFKQVYNYLKAGGIIFNDWSNYYKEALDINKTNQVFKDIMEDLPCPDSLLIYKPGRHLFASAITPAGIINYLDNITENIDTRYIISSEPGCGKGGLLKKIADHYSKHNYFVLYLYSPLKPENPEAVVIPKISRALIASNPLNQPLKNRQNDIKISMLNCLKQDVLKLYQQEINDGKKLFTDIIGKAVTNLKQAKSHHDEIEKYYISAMDFSKTEELRKKLIQQVL